MNPMIKNLASLIVVMIVISSCTQMEAPVPDPGVLMEADRNFSVMSQNEGMNEAFYAFAHPDAVVLRDGQSPLKGKELLKETYWSNADTGYVLTWEPVYADIAASGELGYTYGIYSYLVEENGLEMKGTYVTVWKKDDQGQWKFVLDAGTEGLKEEEF